MVDERPWAPAHWDERYSGDELVWTAEPNRFVVQEVEGMAPGRALDLACGEGRNAVWLAERGWTVTGVDFSPVGLAKAARMAQARGVHVDLVEADACRWRPPDDGFDLVVVAYLQLGADDRRLAFETAASAVAPGGTLVFVAHDADNLVHGVGGPQDPAVLYRAGDVVALLEAGGLSVQKAQQVTREVASAPGAGPTPSGPSGTGSSGPSSVGEGTRQAIDLLVRACRPATASPPARSSSTA